MKLVERGPSVSIPVQAVVHAKNPAVVPGHFKLECARWIMRKHCTRPLKRYLQRQLETTLSRKLLSGDITDHSRVTVDFKKGELVFESKALRTAP